MPSQAKLNRANIQTRMRFSEKFCVDKTVLLVLFKYHVFNFNF